MPFSWFSQPVGNIFGKSFNFLSDTGCLASGFSSFKDVPVVVLYFFDFAPLGSFLFCNCFFLCSSSLFTNLFHPCVLALTELFQLLRTISTESIKFRIHLVGKRRRSLPYYIRQNSVDNLICQFSVCLVIHIIDIISVDKLWFCFIKNICNLNQLVSRMSNIFGEIAREHISKFHVGYIYTKSCVREFNLASVLLSEIRKVS